MLTLGGVELQRPGDGVEHADGHSGQLAALQFGVVLDGDAGQARHLTAAQARHPALPDDGEPRLLRGDLRATAGQELAHL